MATGDTRPSDDLAELYALHGLLKDHELLQGYASEREHHTALLLNTKVLRNEANGRTLSAAVLLKKTKEYTERIKRYLRHNLLLFRVHF